MGSLDEKWHAYTLLQSLAGHVKFSPDAQSDSKSNSRSRRKYKGSPLEDHVGILILSAC